MGYSDVNKYRQLVRDWHDLYLETVCQNLYKKFKIEKSTCKHISRIIVKLYLIASLRILEINRSLCRGFLIK